MDAIMRKTCLFIFSLFHVVLSAQYMNWPNLAEDTIYYAREYFPDRQIMTQPGPAQIWDFRSLRAPYAISRNIMVTGDRTHAQLMNGSQVEAILELKNNEALVTHEIEDNPICPDIRLSYTMTPAYKPFFRGILGEETSYKGKKVTTFAWPKHLTCNWSPAQIPDTCRITYTINEDIYVDGVGTLYLPTEVSSVNRQHVIRKSAVRVETRTGYLWRDVTALVPGVHLVINEEFYRFVSSDLGLMLAEVEVNENEQPIKIEFKTHPIATRIVADEPSKPDIFAFPNPSFDVVRFQLTGLANGYYKLKVLNILGTPVKEVEVYVDDPRKTISIDLGELQRGTYLYRLQDSMGRTIKTKRVVLIQS
jgi:hypothetical protein